MSKRKLDQEEYEYVDALSAAKNMVADDLNMMARIAKSAKRRREEEEQEHNREDVVA